jgi:hypothetical protein
MKDGKETSHSGMTYYWKDNELHREDGPAVEWPDGSSIWVYNGRQHRLDGPAKHILVSNKIWYDTWWVDGKLVPVKSQKEFEQYLKLKVFW